MVVNNTCSEIGDVLIFTFTEPIIGVISLTGFIDVTTGETGTAFFKKEFSYSTNGLFFTEWIDLTTNNVKSIILDTHGLLFVNYRYTRSGTDTSGLLSFTSVNLTGTFSTPPCNNYFVLPNSIFKDFYCNNPQHIGLCAILTKKCYDKGIVPLFIERFNENPAVADKDYIDFWDAVCCFYSLLILHARKFENLDADSRMLEQYLEQRGIFFSPSTQQADLIYIKENYFDEIRQRGTIQVFQAKSGSKTVDGEFLRLIDKKPTDEFIFNLFRIEKCGWCLGQSSPMYKGNGAQIELNKAYEQSQNIIDKTLYPLYSQSSGTITSNYVDGVKNSLRIFNVVSGQLCGIGPTLDNIASSDFTKAIIVDPGIDYEVTFQVRQNTLEQSLTFGCIGFDVNNGYIPLLSQVTGTTSNYFFERQSMLRNDKYYFVRGIIYNKEKQLWNWDSGVRYFKNDKVRRSGAQYSCTVDTSIGEDPSTVSSSWVVENGDDSILNVGYGNNLKMSSNVAKIIPVVLLDRTSLLTTGGDTRIWDFKIRPLVTGHVSNKTRYLNSTFGKYLTKRGASSTGFLRAQNLINIYYKNNNQQLSYEDVDEITRKYLIPYNSTQKNIYL